MMWMELECITLSKISQGNIPYDFIHMWNLRNETNEHRGKGENEANYKKLLTKEQTEG